MEPVTMAAIASGIATAAASLVSHFSNKKATERINRQSQSNFENSYQITANDMVKSGYNPSALFQGGQLSQVPTLQQQQPFDASGLASLFNALTNAKLAEHQAKNIDADTENKEGQFQHEIDMQTVEFKQQIAILGETDKYLKGRMELQTALDISRDEANEKLQEALDDYKTKNQEELIKLQTKCDNWLEKNKSKYRTQEDLRKAAYEMLQHDADYQHQVSLLAQQVEGKMTQQKSVNSNTTKNTVIRGSFTVAGCILGGIIGGPIGAAIGSGLGASASNVIGFDTSSVR